VAREAVTNQVIRLWQDELRRLNQAPFDVGPDAVVVAYMAAAEMGCFLELGWKLPVNVLDLFVEHRVETNGRFLPMGNGMLGALALRGRPHIDAGHKDAMRSLILDRTTWTLAERKAILDYCESDVDGVVALLEMMATSIDWPRALFRGRYMSTVARMERNGVPVDQVLHRTFVEQWPAIRGRLIEEVDRDYGVYDGVSFRLGRFEAFLNSNGMLRPRLPSGTLDLKDDTFKEQTRLYPVLGPLHELRQSLSKLRKSDIQIGPGNRARTSLRPFRSITGRNQPSASEFVFGPSKWLRGIIRPEEGYGIAYIDFVSQEIGIAAGLSGDPRLAEAYAGGISTCPSPNNRGAHPPMQRKLATH
jgi:DNA polymerase I